MAKKGNAKGAGSCDYSITSEEKLKVQRLTDMFPEANRDHITIILKHYDFDSDKATDALTRDGGSSVLSEWNNSMENNQMKVSNKNKKKNKKKNRKDNGSIAVTPVIDADDSSSLHSSNIDFDVEKEAISKLDEEGMEKTEQDSQSLCNSEVESSCDRPLIADENECNILSGDKIDTPEEAKSDDGLIPSLDLDSVENSVAENIERLSPKDDTDDQIKHSSKHNSRQRHGSSRYSKSSSVSEDHSSQSSYTVKNRNYDKSKKDLNRQSVSLQNIQLKVENKLEEANKSLKNAFGEIKDLLDKRQLEIELEMEKVKQEALNLLKSRQELATDLKIRVDRASTAPDSEWFELKTDIKQFVGERKYDDQLGKTTWFCWSMETITKEIEKFGEVAAVKNAYSQRSSQNQSNPDLNQDSSIEANSSQQMQAGFGNLSSESSHEGRSGKMGKETAPKINQGEKNYRVFSNSNYSHQNNFRGGHVTNNRNRGFRGGPHGNTGNYSRGYNYRQYRGNDRYDHKPYNQDYHSMPSFEDRSSGDNVNASDGHNQTPPRFTSNFQNRRPHNRRPYATGGPRGQRGGGYNYGQNRYNKSPRSMPDDSNVGVEAGDCLPPLNQDKPNDTVNGFLEES